MPELVYVDPRKFTHAPVAHLNLEKLFQEPWSLPSIRPPEIPDVLRIRLAGQQIPLMAVLQLGLEDIRTDIDLHDGVSVPHLYWNAMVLPAGIREVILRLQIRDLNGPRFLIKEFLKSLAGLPVGRGARVVVFAGLKQDGSDFVMFDWSALDGINRIRENNLRLEKHFKESFWSGLFRRLLLQPRPPAPGVVEIPDEVPILDPWYDPELQPIVEKAVKGPLSQAVESLLHQMILMPEIYQQLKDKKIPLGQFAFTRLETAMVDTSLRSARNFTRLY